MHLLLSVKAGMFITFTIVLPGAHGATITGTHGIGVSTPMAADVAEATVGLAIDRHIPKVGILAGVKSIGVANNIVIHFGRSGTVTINEQGVIPWLHWSIAPIVTNFPIYLISNNNHFLLIIPAYTHLMASMIATGSSRLVCFGLLGG